jgi:hypothetical protein
MPLKEFIYIDTARLDSYVLQISSGAVRDKTPNYSVEWSLTGPKVGAQQIEAMRAMTPIEKLQCLEAYLAKQNLMANHRPSSWRIHDEHDFRLETFRATKIIVPPTTPESLVSDDFDDTEEFPPLAKLPYAQQLRRQQKARVRREQALQEARRKLAGFKGLTIWFSPHPMTPPSEAVPSNALFLLLDSKAPDGSPNLLSAYSALIAIYDETKSIWEKSVFGSIPADTMRNPTAQFHADFNKDPQTTLAKMGGSIVDERLVHSLYRVRRLLPQRDGSYTTLAYPLYIAAGPAA